MRGGFEERVIEMIATRKPGWMPMEIADLGLVPDLAYEDGDTLVIVETAPRGDIQTLARLSLYDRLVNKQRREVVLVLAAKSFSDRVLTMADRLGIRTVMLPKGSPTPMKGLERERAGVKLTSDKAWRVVSRLLKDQPTSIRNISLLEKVSYGWAYAVCEHLMNHGMARRNGNLLEMTDTDRLMNGAAWERPMLVLRPIEVQTDIEDAFVCAREMEKTLGQSDVDHSFTGYLAGALYTGMAVRYDLVQVYVEDPEVAPLKEIYSQKDGKGVTIQILVPDRDVTTGSKLVDGLRLASPGQTLLDLAGSGAGAIELRRAMLRDYARL